MSKTTIDRALLALLVGMAVLLYMSTDHYPGIAQRTSAYYVKFLAVAIGLLSFVQLGWSVVKDTRAATLHLADHLPRLFGLLVALITFGLMLESLGFFICAAIFIPLVALMLGYRNLLSITLTTLSVLTFIYLIFVTLLSVSLPEFTL